MVTKMVRVTLPEDVWRTMRITAAEEDTSVSGWISHAAWQYVVQWQSTVKRAAGATEGKAGRGRRRGEGAPER